MRGYIQYRRCTAQGAAPKAIRPRIVIDGQNWREWCLFCLVVVERRSRIEDVGSASRGANSSEILFAFRYNARKIGTEPFLIYMRVCIVDRDRDLCSRPGFAEYVRIREVAMVAATGTVCRCSCMGGGKRGVRSRFRRKSPVKRLLAVKGCWAKNAGHFWSNTSEVGSRPI